MWIRSISEMDPEAISAQKKLQKFETDQKSKMKLDLEVR